MTAIAAVLASGIQFLAILLICCTGMNTEMMAMCIFVAMATDRP